MKKVYYAEADRFGYTLQCIAETEEKCRNALIEEYVSAYKKANDGADPRKAYEWIQEHKGDENMEDNEEYEFYAEDAEYYGNFIDELYVQEMELGKVIWT